jgi:hypothetical protein
MATTIPTSRMALQMPLQPSTGVSVVESVVDLDSERKRRQKA